PPPIHTLSLHDALPISLYHTLNPNNQVARHTFDRLVHQDARQRLVPGLALSWKPIDETTWEFKLRPGVSFHDGAPLTAEDIIFRSEEHTSELQSLAYLV